MVYILERMNFNKFSKQLTKVLLPKEMEKVYLKNGAQDNYILLIKIYYPNYFLHLMQFLERYQGDLRGALEKFILKFIGTSKCPRMAEKNGKKED